MNTGQSRVNKARYLKKIIQVLPRWASAVTQRNRQDIQVIRDCNNFELKTELMEFDVDFEHISLGNTALVILGKYSVNICWEIQRLFSFKHVICTCENNMFSW